MNEYLIELFGTCATLGGAIWAYFQAKDEQRALGVANVVLLGVAVTILLSFRFDLVPSIRERQKVSDSLLEDKNARELIQCYLDGSTSVEKSGDRLMKEYAARFHQDFLDTYRQLGQQTYTVDGEALMAFSQKYISMAEKEIIATSYVAPTGWWRGEEGLKYQQANRDLVTAGVNITRYFIVDDQKELKAILDLIQSQIQIGVKVFVIVKDRNLKYQHTKDLILIDGKMGGQLTLSSSRDPVSAVMTTSQAGLQKLRTAIEQMAPYAAAGETVIKSVQP